MQFNRFVKDCRIIIYLNKSHYMQDYGLLSLLPPVIAIFLAIRTKQVFISLITGIWIGWVILSDFNLFKGTIATIDAVVDVFKDAGNTRVVLFTLLVGALIAFMQKSKTGKLIFGAKIQNLKKVLKESSLILDLKKIVFTKTHSLI